MRPATLIVILVFSLFMGVTAISLGFGTLIPSLNRISKPVVCPNGTMDVVRETYRPYPGKNVTTATWFCTDNETGEQEQLSLFPIAMLSGSIYGLGLFVILIVLIALRRKTTPDTAF